MNNEQRRRLSVMYEEYRNHDKRQVDRRLRWRNLEPESAELLAVILRSMRARRILEIGTSNGYSTLWLADAMQATGGHVTSLEIEAERTALAEQSLHEFGLRDCVTLLTCDAAEYLPTTPESFDFILLDAERKYYRGYWPDLKELLLRRPHCLLVVDNVLSHADEVADFIAAIRDDEAGFAMTTVAVGAGLLFVTSNRCGPSL